MGDPNVPAPLPAPTQVEYPWKSAGRTAFQAFLALIVIVPLVVAQLDLTGAPGWVVGLVGGITAGAAAIARIMALPQVNDFIDRFLPFLRAQPKG